MVTLVNRAKMTIVSTGTGPLTLGAAVNGYQSLVAAGVSTGDVVRYIIEDGDAWEIGLGTYSANTSSLSRSVSESSNTGAPISLSGNAIVFLGLSAADINARVEITDPRLSNAREWAAGTISQAEAEAGTATTRRAFTAQRIRQAILGWWTGSSDKAKLDGIAAGAQVNSVTAVAGRTGDVTLAVEDVQNAVGTTDNRLTNSREWTASTITQAEAEAGTATTRRAFTAQRVRQAILGWWTGSSDKAKLDGIACLILNSAPGV